MKNTIIIVEGPQGVGKTTFTNKLREKMGATDLYRLAGIKDKGLNGLKKVKEKYNALLEYIAKCSDINMIFDRTFFTEEIYCKLGYKDYSFSETYNELLEKLEQLNYEIYVVFSYLENTSDYEKRIKRDKHQYQKFEVESSIMQQNEYLKLADELESKTKNIKVIKINNENFEKTEENLQKNFGYLFK